MTTSEGEFQLEKTGIFSLSQMTSLIKSTLENTLGKRIFPIMVEIANVKRTESGVYMELIEKRGEEILSKVRGTLWRNVLHRLHAFEQMTGQRFESGLKILIHGKVTYHPLYDLSISIQDIDVTYTLGQIAQQRKLFIDKLLSDHPGRITESEGVLFTPNKAIQPAEVSQRIAVISSSNSDGYKDFIHELRNNPNKYFFDITLFDTAVQGKTAEEMMIKSLLAIYHKRESFDIVVMIRGGGSDLDFAAYDQYALARSVALFPIPIFTGLGHTRNETLCDLVSCKSFKTPTKVATYLIDTIHNYFQSIQFLINTIFLSASQSIAQEKMNLQGTMNLITNKARVIVEQEKHDLQLKVERIRFLAKSHIQQEKSWINHKMALLKQSLEMSLHREKVWINSVSMTIEEFTPNKRFKQGYFLLKKEGGFISGNDVLTKGDKLELIGLRSYDIIVEKESVIRDFNHK
jgi:exodeoxyribonuclease VII large subunit